MHFLSSAHTDEQLSDLILKLKIIWRSLSAEFGKSDLHHNCLLRLEAV